jgi:hypothetical protein
MLIDHSCQERKKCGERKWDLGSLGGNDGEELGGGSGLNEDYPIHLQQLS